MTYVIKCACTKVQLQNVNHTEYIAGLRHSFAICGPANPDYKLQEKYMTDDEKIFIQFESWWEKAEPEEFKANMRVTRKDVARKAWVACAVSMMMEIKRLTEERDAARHNHLKVMSERDHFNSKVEALIKKLQSYGLDN